MNKFSRKVEKKVDNYDMRDSFSSLFEQHDKFNFQVKSDYKLNPDEKFNKYRLHIYFFIPSELGINSKSYTKEKFFSDKNNRIRFRTPQLSIRSLINTNNKLSPFYRIQKILESYQDGNPFDSLKKDIIYELRVLASVIKSNIRDETTSFIQQTSKIQMGVNEYNRLSKFIADIEELGTLFQTLESKLSLEKVGESIRTVFSICYQYVLLQIQDNLTRLLDELNLPPAYSGLRRKIIYLIELQITLRTKLNSKLVRNPETKNEEYVYWEDLFKKLNQSVLYLPLKDTDKTFQWTEILFSFAAGMAMFISLMLGFAVANSFSQNTTPYILALVVAYILKDRIKDNLRNVSKKAMGFMFPDKSFEIHDSTSDNQIGTIRESMKFLEVEDIPKDIYKIRMAQAQHDVGYEVKLETIIRYSKEVKIRHETIAKQHTRNQNLHDIMKFNIRNFIQYADDPIRYEKWYNKENGKVEEIECIKVYHLNLVMHM